MDNKSSTPTVLPAATPILTTGGHVPPPIIPQMSTITLSRSTLSTRTSTYPPRRIFPQPRLRCFARWSGLEAQAISWQAQALPAFTRPPRRPNRAFFKLPPSPRPCAALEVAAGGIWPASGNRGIILWFCNILQHGRGGLEIWKGAGFRPPKKAAAVRIGRPTDPLTSSSTRKTTAARPSPTPRYWRYPAPVSPPGAPPASTYRVTAQTAPAASR